MTQHPGSNPVVLKKAQQARLNTLIAAFSKAVPNHLLFSELMQLLVDRGIFNLPVTFYKVHNLFAQSSKEALPALIKKPSLKLPEPEKPPLPQQNFLTRQQLVLFLNRLSKVIYHDHKNSVDNLYGQLLSDKTEATSDQKSVRQRTMMLDQNNKKLLVEESILQLMKYEWELRACFNCYIWENYQSVKNTQRILLQSNEIAVQNKKMITVGLVLFLKESEICPNLISIDHVEEFLRIIVPPTGQKQQHFYYKKLMIELYNDDLSKRGKPVIDAADPGLTFFQFEMLMMRIAWESYPKELQKKGVEAVVKRFFDKVGLRTSNEKPIIPSRQMLIYLKNYYDKYKGKEFKHVSKDETQKDARQEIYNKHRQDIYEIHAAHFDLPEILKSMERWLAKLPDMPNQTPQCSPPYDQLKSPKRITIGQPAPAEQKETSKEQSKQGKKNGGGPKKEEEPDRVFEWAKIPQPILSSEDYLKDLQAKLTAETPALSSLQRGDLNIQAIPSLISQSVFPTSIPKDVQEFVVGYRNSVVERNYVLALDNLNSVQAGWKKYCNRNGVDMSAEAQMFIEYNRGSVFCSAGRFDQALNCFINAKNVDSGRLNFNNPDRSLPYMGMGEVFYEISEYQLAARAYLKSREIRQTILGLEHVQTATVFCNLGACFFMLDRNVEALGYTQISQAILSSELGPYHQRTVTAIMNLKKIRRGTSNNVPAFRTPWEVFEKDEFGPQVKKKKEEKKK